MWLTCIDCLQQWNKPCIQKHIQSLWSFYTYCICQTRRKKKPPWQLQSRMPLSDYQEVFSLVGVIREVTKGSNGKKRKLKIWKNVIHCCKCNGQNVSRVSIVKPCVLFSVFL